MSAMKWAARSLTLAALALLVSNAAANDLAPASKAATGTDQRSANEVRMGQEDKNTNKVVRDKEAGNRVKAGKHTPLRAKPGDPPWMRAPQSKQ